MIAKSMIAAATLATTMTLALPADEARADWDVNVGVGVGVGVGAGFYPGYYPGYYPDYYGDDVYPVYKKKHYSCGTVANIVDNKGFHKVKPFDCSLPHYKFTAWKKGEKWIVVTNGKGQITKVYKA
ncbi:MAG: hypothetical protein EHM74_01670 [Hyphomicrobiales bacterium]|jgi:hypothetical protein|nr:MAG: hypothetical protein EHM74_01670 [Hyphomicrobiales bacterium]